MNERLSLVTGAGGFIGSHLVQALVERGENVRALLHYDSRSDWSCLEFLNPDVLSRVEVVSGDVGDDGFMRTAVRGCSCVFHLAALIGVPYSYVAPKSYMQTNVIGTLNVLQSVRDEGVRRLVHTSTSECYGTARTVPITEDHPLQAQSPYAATKIAADKLAESFHLSFGVPVTIVRPFNTFGPHQSARAIIPAIISQALSNPGRILLGSLEPVRDLTYVRDTVEGFIAARDCPEVVGAVVNLGTGRGVSMQELVEIVGRILGYSLTVHTDLQRRRPEQSEVLRLICDASRAERFLGWRPRFTLEEGLARTVEFIRAHPNLYKAERYVL